MPGMAAIFRGCVTCHNGIYQRSPDVEQRSDCCSVDVHDYIIHTFPNVTGKFLDWAEHRSTDVPEAYVFIIPFCSQYPVSRLVSQLVGQSFLVGKMLSPT